jgi:hypothetical protein
MTKKQVNSFLFGYGIDHSNRLQAFFTISKWLNKRNYWYALRSAYEMSDNLFDHKDSIKNAFLKQEPCRNFLMTKAERKFVKQLPERIVIYRGMSLKELRTKDYGVSWTLKKEQAEYFAYTYPRNFNTAHLKKTVHKLEINKKDVIAFLEGREEYEIIYIHTHDRKF